MRIGVWEVMRRIRGFPAGERHGECAGGWIDGSCGSEPRAVTVLARALADVVFLLLVVLLFSSLSPPSPPSLTHSISISFHVVIFFLMNMLFSIWIW